jgi:hypothetical protein
MYKFPFYYEPVPVEKTWFNTKQNVFEMNGNALRRFLPFAICHVASTLCIGKT